MATPGASSDLFVGVDGGGTKTAITLLSSAGAVLASVTVGSTNPNSVGDSDASERLIDGIKEALEKAAGDQANIRSVVLGISGCNSPTDSTRIEGWLKPLFPDAINAATAAASSAAASSSSPSPVLVSAYNDSIAALVSGTSGVLEGMVVISGTGMIAKGFFDGREATAGGNGALIDGGSGYRIGLDVMRAAFSSADGMGPPSALQGACLTFLELERVEQIVDWLYADRSWDRVARLAPLAFRYATVAAEGEVAAPGAPALPTTLEQVDSVARRIIDDAAEYLVCSIRAVAKQLNLAADRKFSIVCAGGVINSPTMFALVGAGVRASLPNAELVQPQLSPSEGAALLARKQWQASAK